MRALEGDNMSAVGPGYTFTTEPARRFVCWRRQRMPPIAFGLMAQEWRHPFAQPQAGIGYQAPFTGWICPFCELVTEGDPR